MKTRTARHLDLLCMHRLSADSTTAVLTPSMLDDASGFLSSTLIPGRVKTWVAEERRTLVGFIQARPRRYVLGWEIVRLHVAPGRDPEPVVAELVGQVLHHLQEHGIPRLFGRTRAGSGSHDILRACGFTHLLSESVFERPALKSSAPEETPVGLRYRMPQDDWPLRQLESSQTPVLVGQLEGLTSLSWSAPRGRGVGGRETTELVVEREGEIGGWVGWAPIGFGPATSEQIRLGILTQADDTEMASMLLDYALHAIGAGRPHGRIVSRLRDYQMPLHHLLEDRGFVEVSCETLHIKHGRLQVMAKKRTRLLELAPTVGAFRLEHIHE